MMLHNLLIGLLLPSLAAALSYNADTLPYTDAPVDLSTKIAVSTLTELGIVEGNPDGTFLPNTPLNRAEFMKIVMGFLPEDQGTVFTACFPDIDPEIWYAVPVCRAKEMDIVSGNELAGIPASAWPFEASRSVQYEEALKILTRIFGVPMPQVDANAQWYQKFLIAAEAEGIHISDAVPGTKLTRGQMARLVVGFVAWSRGELTALRTAESGISSSSSSSSSVSSMQSSVVTSASTSSSASSISSFVSSSSSVVYDPYLDDVSTDGSVIMLGTVSHILASASIFPDAEPLRVEEFLIDLVAANSSIDSMFVYDHDGIYIGRATLDTSFVGNTRYKLRVFNQDIVIPKRESYSFYVRATLKPQDQGGTSGGSIQVDEMGVTGVGDWSSRDYQQWTRGETFATSTVARSAIIEVRNAGDTSGILVPGNGLEIGAFYFAGATGHSAASLKINAIDFTLGITGGVTIASPYLRVSGSSDVHNCSIVSSVITCSALPDSFGEIDDGSRTLRLYGDITVPGNSQSARLQVSINNPGSPSTAGDITWTDGVTTFTWVDTANYPLARGTSYMY